MVTIDPAERLRLIELGKLAMNHFEKQRSFICDPAKDMSDYEKENRALMRIQNDARKLLNAVDFLFLLYNIETDHQRMVKELVDLWTNLQTSTGRCAEIIYPAGWSPSESDSDSAVDEEWAAWCADFYLGFGKGTGRRCTFCGGSTPLPRPLLFCGGCKNVVYCDRMCQVMDWKSGHKSSCAKNEGGKKECKEEEASGEAA
ncbi:hypothetical protein TI39_contig343g00022 [Zymoseptoria brevis]|uniref:MYND-type domain-containing protein n=1 Tax=Zymoseptoria brevis TaxID=1047168 RepID=A0A0F4GV56_9PEZI|nr:hypothetical protein TI39_contig343g00022 [Zymoseptoria brevis]